MSLAQYFGRYALEPLFVVYVLIPNDKGGTDKVPIDPLTGYFVEAHEITNRMPLAEAELYVASGTGHGVGFVITAPVPIFFFDIDHCRDGDHWMPHAVNFVSRFPGAYIECSVSGDGLHVLGTYDGPRPEHRTKNSDYKIELYTGLRFCALTGIGASGTVEDNRSAAFHALAAEYFPPREDDDQSVDWRDGPVSGWSGPTDDDELLRRALRSASAAAVFGGRAAFADLWAANATVLAHAFPGNGADLYDASGADLSLANHLAFWTGNDCERMARLMLLSGLRRGKWDRTDYFQGTILRACSSQREWYNDGRASAPESPATPHVDVVLHVPGAAPVSVPVPLALPAAATPVAAPEPLASVPVPPATTLAPGQLPPPGAYVTLPTQIEMFAGMAYVSDMHQIQRADGSTLDKQRFDATYGGRQYAMTADGQRPSKSAWDCFIGSELADFPKVDAQYFNPRAPAGSVLVHEGKQFINSWCPIYVPRTPGDAAPFVDHVHRILPKAQDAMLLIWYLAACVQNPGLKFMYWPLIQGVEGNGKTIISKIMEGCIGERYTHWPKASQLGSKFNAAFVGKLLVCVNDVFTVEGRGELWETMKPMITEPKMEIEYKGVDKVMRAVCFNGILNTNHKNGLRKTKNDRRIMSLFCAQQHEEDLKRDGLTKPYFNELRRWADHGGTAIVAHYLATLPIPAEYNPAADCIIAPLTSSTVEAIESSHGSAEQEILEMIAQQFDGFRGGWINSTALDHLLQKIGKERAVPRGDRRDVLNGLGYIPHPGLSGSNGRLTARLPDGTKPIMYIQKGHAWALPHLNASQIIGGYMEAQKL